MLEPSSEFCFLYSTFPSEEAARKLARVLIDENWAACVNIYPAMTSLYRWEGTCAEENEIAMFIKTRRSLASGVTARAKALHPYSVPCFLLLPIEAGNADYLAWARSQTERAVSV